MTPIAGKRNVLVQFQRHTEAQDAGGGTTLTPTTFAERWVEMKDPTGSEFQLAQQNQASLSHMLVTDWDSTLATATHKDRVFLKNEDRYLGILAVSNANSRNHELVILCKETVSA